MPNKARVLNYEQLRFLNERRSELRTLSSAACEEARQACAYAAQVQKDIKHMSCNLPLTAVQAQLLREQCGLGREVALKLRASANERRGRFSV